MAQAGANLEWPNATIAQRLRPEQRDDILTDGKDDVA